MINIIVSRFPNFEVRKNSGLALPSQLNDLDGILESNQTLLVVPNDKTKRKISLTFEQPQLKNLLTTKRANFNLLGSRFDCSSPCKNGQGNVKTER